MAGGQMMDAGSPGKIHITPVITAGTKNGSASAANSRTRGLTHQFNETP
jgi:hypothetical protein